jgi:hypothetical protein
VRERRREGVCGALRRSQVVVGLRVGDGRRDRQPESSADLLRVLISPLSTPTSSLSTPLTEALVMGT